MDNHMLAGLLTDADLPEPTADAPLPDSSEQIYIASIALLKMLKHGGITTLVDMPLNSFPSTVCEETLKLKVQSSSL
ncbi:Allantoinase [Hordeum vulgare]|nr:Allantoinase [Hordeum vulgare]